MINKIGIIARMDTTTTTIIPYSRSDNVHSIVAIDATKQCDIAKIMVQLVDKEGKKCEDVDEEYEITLKDAEIMNFDLSVRDNIQDLETSNLLVGAFCDIYIANSIPKIFQKHNGNIRILFRLASGLEDTKMILTVQTHQNHSVQVFNLKYKSDQNFVYCENSQEYLQMMFDKN
jgi:hypothetical protein